MRPLALAVLTTLVALLAASPAVAHDTGEAHDHGLTTHGDPGAALPDSLITQPVAEAELGDVGGPSIAAAAAPTDWCGETRTTDDTANAVVPPGVAHIKLVYAYAKDQPNRFDTLKHRLQANVSLLQRYLAAQSDGRKALRWDMGTSCGSAYVDIQVVALPRNRADYVPGGAPNFTLTRDDVFAQIGGAGAPRNVAIYADGLRGTNGVAGTASLWETDDPTTPRHDQGGLGAVVFGPLTLPSSAYAAPAVMMHEIGHNLGAVQTSDDNHSTGAGHCFDEQDLMCYADGGPRGRAANMTTPCPRLVDADMDETLDCGRDDYFNPHPAEGSYLDLHWNTYAVAHLGPCSTELASSCGLTGAAGDGTNPTNDTPAPTTAWRTSWSPTLSGTDSESPVDAYQWRVGSGQIQRTRQATVAGSEGQVTLWNRVRDGAGNWSSWRQDVVRVDTTPPALTVTCPAAWSTSTTASPTCSWTGADASAGIVSVEVQRGSAPSTTTAYPGYGSMNGTLGATADAQLIRIRATDAAGNTSGWVSDTARWDRSAPTASVTCPAATGEGSTTCHVEAADTASGIASVTWQVGSRAPVGVAPGADFAVKEIGENTVTVVATDVAGLSRTVTATSRVSAPAPVTLACPAGWQPDHAACTASGGSGYTWTLDDDPTERPMPIDVTAHGVHTVTLRGTDTAGDPRTATATVRVDDTAPADVAVACPAGWRRVTTACTITASDPESGVVTVAATLDGAATPVSGGTLSVSTEGLHTIVATATNGAGRTSAPSAPGEVRIDLTDPEAAVDCPDTWSAVAVDCAVTGADAGGSGLAALTARVGTAADAPVSGASLRVAADGATSVTATARDGSGRTRSATDVARVDASAPTAGITCTPLGDGRHRCTPEASDSGSGIASLRLVRDGVVDEAPRTAGVSFEITGPVQVAVTATDRVGRAATSNAVALAGPSAGAGTGTPPSDGGSQAPATPAASVGPAEPAPGSAGVGVSPAPLVQAATSTASARGVAKLAGGTGTVVVSGGSAVVTLRPGSLKAGTYRLEICVGKRCTRRTIRLRKAAVPAALRMTVPASGEVRATFTVSRKAGARFRKSAGGATSAKLG